MKLRLLAGVALIALSVMAPPVLAEVSVHDGTLRIAETDIGYSGGLEPSLERFYRSDSRRSGLFGRGWGSRYETRVEMQADGTLAVIENGCGATVTFHSVHGHPDRWEAKSCGLQQISQTPSGFERHMADGKTETFAKDGRLQRITDSNGNWITVRHEQERIVSIEDNFGRVMTLAYGPDGHLERITGEGGCEARYRFDAEGRLIAATDPDGGEHRYAYGEDGLLITGVSPKDGKVTATYKSGRLTSFGENGSIRRFDRHEGGGWTEILETTEDSEGQRLSTTRRIQLFSTDQHGHLRMWRQMSDRDGRLTDIEYNETGQVAIIRDGNGHSSGFRYDAMGRLLHKETPDETVDMAYDPRTGKVSRVERVAKGARSWSRFAYDARGNLTAAANSQGRKVSLDHDPQGRISKITERGKHLAFTYNRESRPTSVTLRDGGSIQVEYDGKGEIASVKSNGGAATALKVTQAFQNLLELVKPANVKVGL
ncbi:hypothetical protein A6A04_20930 [Paramagnetospirillum marisnigri]|uniref:Rhs family protein n=1 Tax=Paramagnetospirillum marisnigri TaxID=1285242 RepID=A0A178MAL6_9PROT|nr:DUF6531 domain-containing protein [Paramagnetospirillum marisnigri]OAN45227.1 hypothetical protein A6A04_20930 [Paramagnetospirillum marisnigri]